jgi:hypothetical protein
MNGAIGKVVPTAIVAAIATWCCWPYLDEAAFGEAGAKTYSPQVLHALLAPAIASEPSRDPFHIVGTAPSLGAPKEREAAGTKASGDSPSTPKNAAPQKDAAGVPKGLTLSGTYLAGNRRAALINGRLWEQGQRLELSKNAAEPWVLAEVSPFGVVIASGGKSFELKYPGPEERPAGTAKIAEAAAPPPAKRAEPAVQSKPARQSPPARTAPTAKASFFKPSK